ncbi:MAG: hypothetical protein U0Y08_14330 [Bacteroidia bacterium]
MRTDLYISELLYTNDCVIIPGLGGFVANTRTAFLNPAQHTFTPPARRVAFNASLRTNDGLLVHYVSRREGLSYGEALAAIKIWVEDVLSRLQSNEQVWIHQIGSLSFDAEQRIQFEPDLTNNYLTDAFGLVSIHSPAIRRDEQPAKVRKLQPKQKTGKRQGWKLLELIPAAAVLALLAFNPNVIKTLNAGLANILPLKEIFTEPEVHYSGLSKESKPAYTVQPAAPQPSAPVDSAALLSGTPEETTPVDSTHVEPVAVEVESLPAATNSNGSTFHVIGGCFRSEENARKLVEEANLLGFQAEMLGVNEKGLHVVSLFSSSKMSEVQTQLTEIRTNFEKGAWVMVK